LWITLVSLQEEGSSPALGSQKIEDFLGVALQVQQYSPFRSPRLFKNLLRRCFIANFLKKKFDHKPFQKRLERKHQATVVKRLNAW